MARSDGTSPRRDAVPAEVAQIRHAFAENGDALRDFWFGYVLGPAVAEAAWSEAEWAVAPRFDNPRATILVLVLG